MLEFNNLTNKHLTIKKGERIGQGIFYKVPMVSYGVRLKGDKRGGGFGSTNRSK